MGQVRKQTIIRATLLLLCLTVVCGIKLWNSGLLCTIDRCPSPDGENMVTVYGKAFGDWLEFSFRDATALIREDQTDGGHTQIQYLNTRYRGLWWSPDGRKYVVALHYPEKGKDYLALNWLDYNRESNLNAYLSMGVDASELRRYGTATPGIWPEIRYEFLQWGADSASMLIYYTFDDADSAPHEGYFWYNCETGSVKAVLELEE